MRVPTQALRQRVTIEKHAGEGAYGATFDPASVARASIQRIASMKVEWKNDDVTVNVMAIIRPEDGPVPIGSKVTEGDEEFIVVKAFAIPDEYHPSHYELMLRTWGLD